MVVLGEDEREDIFDLGNLTNLIKRFEDIRNELQDFPDDKQMSMHDFLTWSEKILPLLSGEYEAEDILFHIGMVNAFLFTENPETRSVYKYAILNLIDAEFTDFMGRIRK